MSESTNDPNLTVEAVDRALAKARELPEHEVALLWATRAGLLGVPFHVEQLVYLMGITEERAQDLEAVLVEQGFIEHA